MKKLLFSSLVVSVLIFCIFASTHNGNKAVIYNGSVQATELHTVVESTTKLVQNDEEMVQQIIEPVEVIKFMTYDVPETSGYKSFMPYSKNGKSIFSSSSNQRKLQELCVTGNHGIRMYQERYCVAIGSGFNTYIGQYFDLILENGTIIPCVMADQKADCHTNSDNIVTSANGCMSEFVVDYNNLDSMAMKMGDISYCDESWNARVVSVKVYEDGIQLFDVEE